MNIRMVADKKVEGVLMGRKGETPEPRGGEDQLKARFRNGGMASLPLSRNCENFSILGAYTCSWMARSSKPRVKALDAALQVLECLA